MKNWKRAALFIQRKKKKTIFLFLIMWLCLFAILIMGIIRENVSDNIKKLREDLSGYFTIIPSYNSTDSAELFSDEFCMKIINENNNILTYNGIDVFYLFLPDVKLTQGRFSDLGETEKAKMTAFISNTNTAYNEKFYLGELELVEGEHLTLNDKNGVLISDVLADTNNLHLGDRINGIVMKEYSGINTEAIGTKYVFQVKGIYHINNLQSYTNDKAECEILENQIYVNANIGHTIIGSLLKEEMDWYRYGISIYVKDSSDFLKTQQQIINHINLNQSEYEIKQNNEKYLKSAEMLEQYVQQTDMFILLTTIMFIVLMLLILFMSLKSRMREIGIFMSIGIEKKNILGQFLFENLYIYFMAYICAVVSVLLFVRNNLLSFFLDKNEIMYIGEFDICKGIFLKIALVGEIIVFAIVVIGCSKIWKVNPKNVLEKIE